MEDESFLQEINGTKRWYKKGTYHFHRVDGPAIIYENGDKTWYINGKSVARITINNKYYYNEYSQKIEVNSEKDIEKYFAMKAFW